MKIEYDIESDIEKINQLTEEKAQQVWAEARQLIKDVDRIRAAAYKRVDELRAARTSDEKKAKRKLYKLRVDRREAEKDLQSTITFIRSSAAISLQLIAEQEIIIQRDLKIASQNKIR